MVNEINRKKSYNEKYMPKKMMFTLKINRKKKGSVLKSKKNIHYKYKKKYTLRELLLQILFSF